jgi:hypothetical protein
MGRNVLTICSLAIAMAVIATTTVYAHSGQPSRSDLDNMGLAGMTVMSDHDAMGIRGQGFSPIQSSSAQAFGGSAALLILPGGTVVGGAGSLNVYNSNGTFIAKGHNYSEAGATISSVQAVPGVGSIVTATTIKVWAGGSSSSKAF